MERAGSRRPGRPVGAAAAGCRAARLAPRVGTPGPRGSAPAGSWRWRSPCGRASPGWRRHGAGQRASAAGRRRSGRPSR
ncbi:hypothetical protein D7223_16540 [Micromonospora endolithica]|uniref:Uncharacterized protein n=1 Tax=Micromonospora endolithica TaxID=230091 RepID=A0A3A9ZD00_9ACTN|nr:hypothetical protein D7223_16540 [Micromonospora endolithica]